MNVRKFFAILFVVIVGIIIFNISSAYADEIQYEVIEVEIPEGGETNASFYINEALAEAANDRSKYYKVVVNPIEGQSVTQYYCPNQIRVYSNTWLYVNDQGGATPIVFNKCHEFAMVTAENRDLKVNGYTGFKNIIIEGGIWNGKTDYYNGVYYNNAGFNHFRFAHGTNFEIRNLKIINNNNAHHVQVAGIDGFKVTGCTFEGYNRLSDSYKEAIQMDILSSVDVFGSAHNYDDTPMINVDINNNVFRNVDRGVGTHSATVGVYHRNIKIYNNTFVNIDDYAVAMMNYKDCVVEKNVMSNVEGGVVFMNAKADFTQFYKPNVLVSKVDPVCNTIIRNNDITLNNDLDSVGIRSYGMLPTEANKSIMVNKGVGFYDYSVSGITITNNIIRNAKGDGIGLVGTVNSTVTGNSIYYGNSTAVTTENSNGKAIYLKNSLSNNISSNVIDNTGGCNNLKHGVIVYGNSTNNTVKSNTVKGVKWYGIYLKEASSATIDSNIVDDSKKTAIYLIGKSTATVNKNKLTNIKGNGIYVSEGSSVPSITGNQILTVSGEGIYVYNKATVSNIHNNIITGAKSEGIYVYNSGNVSSIYNNKITSTGDNGIYIRTSSKCTEIKSNTLSNIQDNGIYIDYKCIVNNIISNVITSTGKVGVYVNNKAVAYYINSNKITSAKANGIYIKKSTCTDIKSNIMTSCKVTLIEGSTVSNVNNNKITGTASHGLYVKNSTITSVNSNNVASNKSNGIYVFGSTVKNINSNTCSSNKNKGIYINKSKVTNVKSNKLNSNKSNGLYIYNSTITTSNSNQIKSNTSHGLYVYKSKITSLNSNSVSSSKYNGIYVNASNITNLKSNKVSSSKEHGIYIKAKSKIKYLYSNKVSGSKKKAIYIYKSTVSKIKGNSGKVVKKR